MAAPTLTLDDFAKLTAQMDAGLPRQEVLAAAGLTMLTWLEVQATWLERMAKRVQQGQPTLHRRYLDLLEEHRQAVEQAQFSKQLQGESPRAPEERGSPLMAKARRQAERAAAPAPMPALQVAPVVAPPPLASATGPTRVRATMGVGAAMPAVRATPFDAVARDSHPRPAPRAPDGALPFRSSPTGAPTGAPPLEDTADEDSTWEKLNEASSSALPFKPGNAAPPPSVVELKPAPGLGSTLDLSPEEVAKLRAALPFPKGREAPERGAAVEREQNPLAATTNVSAEVMAKVRSALPFSGGSPAPQPKRPSAPDHALPFSSAKATPVSPTSDLLPQLSVEQYAWLCAMLELSPDRETELLGWLRLTPYGKGQLDAHWRHELKRDHLLKSRFEQARMKYVREGSTS